MSIVIAGVVAGLVAAGLWRLSRTTFGAPVLLRRNYRDLPVPVGVGILLGLTAVTVEALWAVADVLDVDLRAESAAGRVVALAVSLGFGLLGLFDDLAASGDDRGFRGHLTSMAKGRLTTGGVKVLGGGLLALVVVHWSGADDPAELIVGAALVALAANLGNLFDRAPGRCTKVALLSGALVVAGAGPAGHHQLVGMAVVLGAGAGLLWADLREELMLGDAGSNVLGAIVGVGVVQTAGLGVQLAVLIVVAALNVASEKVSFSRVIDSAAPLRWLDRLGRHPRA